MQIAMGRLFHKFDATKENAWSPMVLRRDLGCTKSNWADDLRALPGVYGLRSSTR